MPTMVNVDREKQANHGSMAHSSPGHFFGSDDECNLFDSFDPTAFPQDRIDDDNPNFVQLFQGNGDILRGLYNESKRKPPSKANRSFAESSPLRLGDTMSTATRSKGPAPDPDENAPIGQVPRKSHAKLPLKGNNLKDATATGGESLRNINKNLTKKDEARISQKAMHKYVEQFAAEDKAKTKPVLLETLALVRKDFFVSHRMLAHAKTVSSNLEESLIELQGDHAKLRNDNVQLKIDLNASADDKKVLEKKLAKAIADLKSRRSGKVIAKSNDILKEVRAQANGWLFSNVKFIQSFEEELDAAKLLFKLGKFEKTKVDTKQKRADLAETYKTHLKKAIFMKRNYVGSQTKTVVFKRLNTPGAEPLSLEDMILCLQRKITTEEEMKKFMVYTDEYMPKHVGATEWGPRVRLYTTISAAKRKDFPQMPLITPEDEAFMVLVVHNGQSRWIKEWEKLKAKAKAEADGEEWSEEVDEAEGKEGKKGGVYDGVFTRTTLGQGDWGGWQPDGLEMFNQYRAMNVLARKSKDCAKVEKDCLQRLREENGIEEGCDNAEDHERNKVAKKRLKKRGLENAQLPPKKKTVRTLVVPDSSEEEDNGDLDTDEAEEE